VDVASTTTTTNVTTNHKNVIKCSRFDTIIPFVCESNVHEQFKRAVQTTRFVAELLGEAGDLKFRITSDE